jgi:hypothetical protein
MKFVLYSNNQKYYFEFDEKVSKFGAHTWNSTTITFSRKITNG